MFIVKDSIHTIQIQGRLRENMCNVFKKELISRIHRVPKTQQRRVNTLQKKNKQRQIQHTIHTHTSTYYTTRYTNEKRYSIPLLIREMYIKVRHFQYWTKI